VENDHHPFAVVVGAGPGLGAAVGRRLGRDGHRVALVARDAGRLEALASELRADGIDVRTATADAADGEQLTGVVDSLARDAGGLDVLHFNPSRFRPGGAADVTPRELLDDLALGAVGLLAAVRGALPHLAPGSTVLATGSGAADRPMRGGLTLGVQKAALRALVVGLAADLGPRGVHVATVIVRGTIAPGTPFAPDVVADAFAALVAESAGPRDGWTTVADLGRDGLARRS
jgi:NAD(P)-dependent dehydrogenase (short-subunit alcohol dehydrogenase family)